MLTRTVFPILAMALALTFATPASASGADWEHGIVVYMIGASIDGSAGVGGVTADVDVGFDEILESLDFGAMAAYRAERGRWAFGADLIYMDLDNGKEGLGPSGATEATIGLQQLIGEGTAGYAVTEHLDVYGGLRVWDVDSDVAVVGGGPLGETLAASAGDSWVDPIVGVRYALPLAKSWMLVGRGDIGGFGVGSDFSWHVTVFADWKFGDHTSLLFGFRHLDVDYEEGEGPDRFAMDLAEGGPTAGIAWRF